MAQKSISCACPLLTLPLAPEILLDIADLLSLHDMSKLITTCTFFRDFLEDEILNRACKYRNKIHGALNNAIGFNDEYRIKKILDLGKSKGLELINYNNGLPLGSALVFKVNSSSFGLLNFRKGAPLRKVEISTVQLLVKYGAEVGRRHIFLACSHACSDFSVFDTLRYLLNIQLRMGGFDYYWTAVLYGLEHPSSGHHNNPDHEKEHYFFRYMLQFHQCRKPMETRNCSAYTLKRLILRICQWERKYSGTVTHFLSNCRPFGLPALFNCQELLSLFKCCTDTTAKWFVLQGVDVNAKDPYVGFSLLQAILASEWATKAFKLRLQCDQLLTLGADINTQDVMGCTPLMNAMKAKDPDKAAKIKWLLENNADVVAYTSNQKSRHLVRREYRMLDHDIGALLAMKKYNPAKATPLARREIEREAFRRVRIMSKDKIPLYATDRKALMVIYCGLQPGPGSKT